MNADYALAASIGRQLEDILGKEGEAKFQQCLSEVLSNHLEKDNSVVVTDDCIIDLDKNQRILSNEFTVYLKVSTHVQIERISHNRPFLPVSDYKAFLEQLHQKRDALYEKVTSLTVNSDDNDLEGQIKKIVSAVGK